MSEKATKTDFYNLLKRYRIDYMDFLKAEVIERDRPLIVNGKDYGTLLRQMAEELALCTNPTYQELKELVKYANEDWEEIEDIIYEENIDKFHDLLQEGGFLEGENWEKSTVSQMYNALENNAVFEAANVLDELYKDQLGVELENKKGLIDLLERVRKEFIWEK